MQPVKQVYKSTRPAFTFEQIITDEISSHHFCNDPIAGIYHKNRQHTLWHGN